MKNIIITTIDKVKSDVFILNYNVIILLLEKFKNDYLS